MRPLKKDSNKVEERKFIAITVALWVIVLILVPVLLNITCIKQLFLYLISFTNSADYKISQLLLLKKFDKCISRYRKRQKRF